MTHSFLSSPNNKQISKSGRTSFLDHKDKEVGHWKQEPGYGEIEQQLFMGNEEEDDQYTVNTFTAATRLLEKRREMLEVHNTLKSKRDEFQERLRTIKEKEASLSHKRNELTDNIIELDKFIGVCKISY